MSLKRKSLCLTLTPLFALTGCCDAFVQPVHVDVYRTKPQQILYVLKQTGLAIMEPCPNPGGCGGGVGDCPPPSQFILGILAAMGSASACDPFATDGDSSDDICNSET